MGAAAAIGDILAEANGRVGGQGRRYQQRSGGFHRYTRRGYIDLLFTRPEFARRGVARRLLVDAESLLRWTAGVSWTDASFAARGFFTRQGYSLVREQKVSCWGVELRDFLMRKDLAPWSRGM
jgi:putative acetyltransferase